MASVRFLPAHFVHCGAQSWRTGSAHFITVVVKTTVGIFDDGSAQLVDGDAVFSRDTHHDDNPARSVLDCSDLAPFLGRGEVLFFGNAYGPSGTRSPARMTVLGGSGGHPLVDKSILVSFPASGAAICQIPVTYENALGGLGYQWNPVGREDPLLFHATAPNFPGAMGPLSHGWQMRTRLLRPSDKPNLRGKALTIDEGFNYGYFHAAPPDQRAPAYFSGDEAIWLEGLWRGGGRVQIRLPELRAEAYRLHSDGEREPIPLVADRLRVDGEREIVSLTWRGRVPLREPDEHLVVTASVGSRGEALQWPDFDAEDDSVDMDDPGTMQVSIGELGSRTMPFKTPGSSDSQLPPAPASAPAPPSAPVMPAPVMPGTPWSSAVAPMRVVIPSSKHQKSTLHEGIQTPKARPAEEPPRVGDVLPPQYEPGKSEAPPRVAPLEAQPVEALPPPPPDGGVVELGPGLGGRFLVAMVSRVRAG